MSCVVILNTTVKLDKFINEAVQGNQVEKSCVMSFILNIIKKHLIRLANTAKREHIARRHNNLRDKWMAFVLEVSSGLMNLHRM